MPRKPSTSLMTEDKELDLVRALARNLDHSAVRLLAHAAGTQRALLDQMDSMYPDPERRADAKKLGELAAVLDRVNVVRDFLEEQAATR
jgi:hypothetical protein